MKTNATLIAPLFAAAIGTGMSGCAGKPLQVSPVLSSSATRLAVTDHDRHSLSFGEYKAQQIKRGANVKLGLGIGGAAASKKMRNFSFAISQGDTSMQVDCKMTQSGGSSGGIGVSDPQQTLCDLGTEDAAWKVIIVARDKNTAQGRLQRGDREIQIRANHGGMFGARGYVLSEDQEIAAVDVGNKTRTVWLRDGLSADESLAFAAAATALMVYEDIS